MPTFFDKNTNRFDKKNSLVPVWQRFGQGLVMPWEQNQNQDGTSSQQEASNGNTLDTQPRQVQQPTWLQNPGINEEQERQEPQQTNQDRNDSGYSVAASLENNQDDTNWFGDSFGIKTAYADTGEESGNQNDDARNSYVESSKIGSKIRNDLTKYAQGGVNPNDAIKNILLGKSPEDFSNPELQNPITEKLKTQITFPEKKDKSYLNDEDANNKYHQYVNARGWRQTDEQIERAKDRYLNPFVLGNSQTDLLSEHGLSNQLDVVTADESTIDDIVSDSRFSLLDSPQELQNAYSERLANEKASMRKAREQERDQAIFKFFNRLFENDPEVEALKEELRQENDEFLKDLNEQASKETSGISFYDSNASGNTDVPTGVGRDDSFNLDAISTVAVGPTQVDNITQEQNDFVGPTQVDNITQEQNDFVGPTQVHESPLDSWISWWADQFQKAEELNKQNEQRLAEAEKQQEEENIKAADNIKKDVDDDVNYITSGQLLNDIADGISNIWTLSEHEREKQEKIDNLEFHPSPYESSNYIGILGGDMPDTKLGKAATEYNNKKRIYTEETDDVARDDDGQPVLDENGNVQLQSLSPQNSTVTKEVALELNRQGIVSDEVDDIPIRYYPDNTLFPKYKLGLPLDVSGWVQSAIDRASTAVNDISDAWQHDYTISINGKDPIREGDFNTLTATGWYNENIGNNAVTDKYGNRYTKDTLPSLEDTMSGNYSVDIDEDAKSLIIERSDGAITLIPFTEDDLKQEDDGSFSLNSYVNDFLNAAYNNVSSDSFISENLSGEYKPKKSNQTFTLEEVAQILDDSQAEEDDDTAFNKYDNIKYDWGLFNFFKPYEATAPATSIEGWTTDIIPNLKNIGLSSARFVFPKVAWPMSIVDLASYSSGSKTPMFGGTFSKVNAAIDTDTKNLLKKMYMSEGMSEDEANEKVREYVNWWSDKDRRMSELALSQLGLPIQEYGFTNNMWGANWLKYFPKTKKKLSALGDKYTPDKLKKFIKSAPGGILTSALNEGFEEIPGDISEEAGESGFGGGYYASPINEDGIDLKDSLGNSLVEYNPGFLFWDDNWNFKQDAFNKYLEGIPESASSGALFGAALGALTRGRAKLKTNAYMNNIKKSAKNRVRNRQANINWKGEGEK